MFVESKYLVYLDYTDFLVLILSFLYQPRVYWQICVEYILTRSTSPLDSDEVKMYPWWRHQMETFSAWLALCAGNSPVPVNSPLKGQWRGALMFPLICVWINDWVNNHEAGDLRRHRGHYDVNVMSLPANMRNDIFALIPTIILPKVLTLCYPLHLETLAVIHWSSCVAPKWQREK